MGSCIIKAKPKDESERYKASYNAKQDDAEGYPLSSLIACPFVACMYNRGLFKSLDEKVEKAKAEPWKGWDQSPAHKALYDSKVSHAEVIEAQVEIGVAESTSFDIATLVSRDGGVKLFQLHTPKDKHGHATRIRYDHEKCVGGYSASRFDLWWNMLDKNDDGKMSKPELVDMLKSLTRAYNDKSAPTDRDHINKTPVFTLLYFAFKGDEIGGVGRDTVEDLYRGTWKGKFALEIPRFTNAWNMLEMFLRVDGTLPLPI